MSKTNKNVHKDIMLDGMPAYHSYPDGGEKDVQKHPGLIVIHEIWGLNDHIKDVADRFAKEGYSVVAPNLFHGMSFEGKIDQSLLADMADPEKRNEAQKKMRAAFAPIQAPEFADNALANLKRCVEYLLVDNHVNGEVAVLGFCFGGSYSFHLAAHDDRLKAAVSFYGHPPKLEEVRDIQCPVLAFYGDQDANLMQSLPQLKEEMKNTHKDFEPIVYPGTGHAFFNDTNPRMYNAPAADDAWVKTLAFLAKELKV